MYAVIQTGGKQYRVQPEDVIEVEKLDGDVGDSVAFEHVLMLGGDGEAKIGTPHLDGVSVAATVVEQGRGPKILVFKKKRRKNYRRKKGHRQHLTTVRITDILTDARRPATKAEPEAKKARAKEPGPEPESAKSAVPTDTGQPLFERPAGEPDDLTRIKGVGPVIVKKLDSLGITQFAQIAALSPEDIAKVDELLNFKGRIERDGWLGQAKALAEGGTDG